MVDVLFAIQHNCVVCSVTLMTNNYGFTKSHKPVCRAEHCFDDGLRVWFDLNTSLMAVLYAAISSWKDGLNPEGIVHLLSVTSNTKRQGCSHFARCTVSEGSRMGHCVRSAVELRLICGIQPRQMQPLQPQAGQFRAAGTKNKTSETQNTLYLMNSSHRD